LNAAAKERRRKKQRRELEKKPVKGKISRKKATAAWDDHPLKGTIHALWTHGTVTPLTYVDIGELIYYGWRTVKSQINYIIMKSFLKSYITMGKSGRKNTYFLDPSRRQVPFDMLCHLLEESYYKNKFGPNLPEQMVKMLLDEIEPHQWKYTGDVTKKNQFAGKYPDLSHKFAPYLIEFNGIYHHGEPDGMEERKRKRLFAENGKYTLFLCEYDLQDRCQMKEKIIRFRSYKKPLNTKKQIEEFLNMRF